MDAREQLSARRRVMIPPEGPDAVQCYVDAVHEDGRFWMSKATIEGIAVLRACVTNARTDEAVIDELADFLRTAPNHSGRS